MIRKLAKLGASGALALALFNLTGCFFLRGWDGGDSTGDIGTSTDYVIEDAWLRGNMETVGAFDTDAYEIEQSGYDGLTSVTLHGTGIDGDGWAMIRLNTYLDGGFTGDDFAPGAQLTSENGDVSVTGCSGPSHGDWDFDGGGDVQVQVEQGPTAESRILYYQATYRDGQTTEGSMTLYVQ